MNNIIIYQEIRRVYFEQSFRMFSSTTKIDYIKVDCINGGLQTGSQTNRLNFFHISATGDQIFQGGILRRQGVIEDFEQDNNYI